MAKKNKEQERIYEVQKITEILVKSGFTITMGEMLDKGYVALTNKENTITFSNLGGDAYNWILVPTDEQNA